MNQLSSIYKTVEKNSVNSRVVKAGELLIGLGDSRKVPTVIISANTYTIQNRLSVK